MRILLIRGTPKLEDAKNVVHDSRRECLFFWGCTIYTYTYIHTYIHTYKWCVSVCMKALVLSDVYHVYTEREGEGLGLRV